MGKVRLLERVGACFVLVVIYDTCSKISYTFHFLFSNKGWNSQNACQKREPGRPWSDCFFRNSLIWVCPVCLGLWSRQLLVETLEHLPYVWLSLMKRLISKTPCYDFFVKYKCIKIHFSAKHTMLYIYAKKKKVQISHRATSLFTWL